MNRILFNFSCPFLLVCFFTFNLFSQQDLKPSASSSYEVAAIGAATSGFAIEGAVGAIHKGNRLRFYCHSPGPTPGLVGLHQPPSKLSSLKDQPGVYPAPLMGSDALHFVFSIQETGRNFTPVIVKPDGTIFKGVQMNTLDSPQLLEIPYPAQTGIYTIFVLNHPSNDIDDIHQGDSIGGLIQVSVCTSTHPNKMKNFFLKSFDSGEQQAEFISAEYIYTR